MDDTEFVLRRRGLSQQLIDALTAMFGALAGWRDADVDPFLAQALPLVQSGQQMLGQLTAIYVAGQVADELTPPAIPDSAVTGLRAGVDMAQVYTRPFVTVRTALSKGKNLDEAVSDGRTRLGQIAEMDLQQTYAHASRAAMEGLPVEFRPRYWARVLQGEYDCALCVVASTQRYNRGDLNRIHPACDCLVKPLNARTDPGQVIAPALLEQVHAAVEQMTGTTDRGGRAPDYRKLLTQMTGKHSELGDLLHDPDDHFTTERELDA